MLSYFQYIAFFYQLPTIFQIYPFHLKEKSLSVSNRKRPNRNRKKPNLTEPNVTQPNPT